MPDSVIAGDPAAVPHDPVGDAQDAGLQVVPAEVGQASRNAEGTSHAFEPARGHRRAARIEFPGPAVHPVRRMLRYWLARLVAWSIVHACLRVTVEGRERYPRTSAVFCFNHLNWVDPFVLMGVVPFRPRLYFFGPMEANMQVGGRNRLMSWVGTTVPYRPGKTDLLEATRRVQRIVDAGGSLGIAGEGRIHARERDLLPLNEGAAYFALRSRVPLVPIAINGTSWLSIGRHVRIRIGEPIDTANIDVTRESVVGLTERLSDRLVSLLADWPDTPPPGRFGRWLTELFNEWPEGSRPEPAPGEGHRGLG